MFKINADNSIYLTRGDAAIIDLTSVNSKNELHKFQPGDKIRFRILEKNKMESVILKKDFIVNEESESVALELDSNDTKIGPLKSLPVDYWYEIELNPDTVKPITLIGYDTNGAKIFRIFPEGGDGDEVNG